MAANKVIYNGSTLIDLTADTVSPSSLLAGVTAHDKAGNLITGTYEELDISAETAEYTSELDTQDDLIDQIAAVLESNFVVPSNLQNKSVTPTTSQQTVTADEGYDALSTVTVAAIPQSYTNEIYQNGYNAGNESGYESGYNAGNEAGYKTGYDAAKPYTDELEGIKSSGTQYIDSGVICDNASIYEIEFSCVPNGSAMALLGCQVNTSTRTLTVYFDAYGYLCFTCGSASASSSSCKVPYTNGTRYDVVLTVNTSAKTINAIVNGNALTQYAYSGTVNTANSVHLLNNNGQSGQQFIGQLDFMTIKKNDIVIRDYIAITDMDDVPCLYDKVKRTRYYNAGTGDFIAGAVKAA